MEYLLSFPAEEEREWEIHSAGRTVRAEPLLIHHRAQVAVGGRNQSRVRAQGAGTAETLKLSLL
jgi:hypothetical protein